MPRILRGHHLDVAMPAEENLLVQDLENVGFTPNAFLNELATVAFKFVREEEKRFTNTLLTKDEPTDHVVCRPYNDVQGRVAYLMLRRSAEAWNLTAILFE